jgi:hypothetical protein
LIYHSSWAHTTLRITAVSETHIKGINAKENKREYGKREKESAMCYAMCSHFSLNLEEYKTQFSAYLLHIAYITMTWPKQKNIFWELFIAVGDDIYGDFAATLLTITGSRA